VVVVNPGWGDAVQANKAGLLEVADIFVINKADRPGAKETARDLEMMLMMTQDLGEWTPPILTAVATSGDGVAEVWDAIGRHRSHLEDAGLLDERRRRRLESEVRAIVSSRLEQRAYQACRGAQFDELLAQVVAREVDPYAAAEQVLRATGEGD
jgi:LAO/AO transport system kinase